MNFHFDRIQWGLYATVDGQLREARVPGEGAGHCGVCSDLVPGRRGRSHVQSRQYHLFNDCQMYPWSKSYLD